MRYLLQPVTLCIRYFPQLAACYLLGYLGRTGAIELAARVGYDNDLWASLIMPLAGMARLGSYVAMFFVIRQGIPTLAALPALHGCDNWTSFATIIAPFFAIYLAWQMFREDWSVLRSTRLWTTGRPCPQRPPRTDRAVSADALPVGTVIMVLIVAALVARLVFGLLKDRMPAWLLPRAGLSGRVVGVPGADILGQSRGDISDQPVGMVVRATDHRVVQPHLGKRPVPLPAAGIAVEWCDVGGEDGFRRGGRSR